MLGIHYDGADTATEHKFSGYFTTSAKTGEGIDNVMGIAIEEVSVTKWYENLMCCCFRFLREAIPTFQEYVKHLLILGLNEIIYDHPTGAIGCT